MLRIFGATVQFSHPGDQAPRICAPLMYTVTRLAINLEYMRKIRKLNSTTSRD
jgi:hypothetical protein